MKINLPVTDKEYSLTKHDSLVSKTDLSGTITYANEDFIRISGFSKEELVGAFHNIVRHPDMPLEVFEDMWRAVKSGLTWTGVVKNRCKNGDYYWVLTNVTPIYEKGQLAGYLSVRNKASSQQIEDTSAAYRLFIAGKAGNLKIKDGKVIKSTLFEKLNIFTHLSIKTRLTFIIGFLSLMMLILGGLGLLGISKSNDGLRTVYEDRTIPMNQLAIIQKLLLTNRLRITGSLNDLTTEVIQKNIDEVNQNTAEINKTWALYIATYLTPEEAKLAEKFAENKKRFVAEGLEPAIAALRDNNMTLTNDVIVNKIRPLYEPVGVGIQNLLQLQIDVAKQEFDAAQSRYMSMLKISAALITTGIILALWLGTTLIRAIVHPLNASINHLYHIAYGNYKNAIVIDRQDEIGKLMETIKLMQLKIGFDTAEAKRIANENLRIKIGLDNVNTGVMIADNARNIIYANKSVIGLLSKAESNIRKNTPTFSADSLVGSNMDSFHINPQHQEQLLANLSDVYSASLNIGGQSIVVTASPVINEQGHRLGVVAEWLDRTTEAAVEKEVEVLVVAASKGDFTQRFDLTGKQGFFRELGEGLNQLLHTSETGLNEVVRVLDALSRGDLTEKITNDYAGTFGQLKDDANATVDKLQEIVNNIKDATNTINTGAKEIAAGNNDLSHRTEEQAASLEQTAASMEELTSTVQANTAHAKQANELAVGASDIAGKGVKVVSEVVTTMEEINTASRKIVDIISVIDDIAFQTNILALNAAVEAARAGDQGRGFAVVAVEVRNLAQRATIAAAEIKGLIGDSVIKVADGTNLVAQAGKTMEEIVNAIQGVTSMMSEISAASIEQTSGIEQVNQAIAQMDDVTQQNAALVEQAAAAAESLEEQAQNLATTVSCFKVNDYSTNPIFQPQVIKETRQETTLARATTLKTTAATQPKLLQPVDSNDWEEF